MTGKAFHLHLVSDATGETLGKVAQACIAQFDGVTPIEHVWSLVRTPGQVNRVLVGVSQHPGIVLFTIVDQVLRRQLEEGCAAMTVPCCFVLQPTLATLASYLGQVTRGRPGVQHELNADYFRRIEAMEFTLAHDDGQATETLDRADVVVVGVSRTSKTPTCLYLANRGLRAANVPLVPHIAPPEHLLRAARPVVVGLAIDPGRLVQIRRSRISTYGQEMTESDYVDPDRVREEVVSARRLCQQHGWPVIDVTRKSVEEVAAAIYQMHADRQRERLEATLAAGDSLAVAELPGTARGEA